MRETGRITGVVIYKAVTQSRTDAVKISDVMYTITLTVCLSLLSFAIPSQLHAQNTYK